MKGFLLASFIFAIVVFPAHSIAFFNLIVYSLHNMTVGLFI
jgi:hypothetical protein